MSYTLTSGQPTSIRSFLLGKIALPSVRLYGNIFKRYKTPWSINRYVLKSYPKGSIGSEMSAFLYENNIDLEPKMENHDFFHVVLGYGTTLPEEAALHFFLIGNGKQSHYPLFAAFVGFLFFPEYYDLYIDAYHRGRCTRSFVNGNVRTFLREDIGQFRQQLKLPARRI